VKGNFYKDIYSILYAIDIKVPYQTQSVVLQFEDQRLSNLKRIDFFRSHVFGVALLTSGQIKCQTGLFEKDILPGELFFLRSGELRTLFLDPSAKGYLLLFSSDFLKQIRLTQKKKHLPYFVAGTSPILTAAPDAELLRMFSYLNETQSGDPQDFMRNASNLLEHIKAMYAPAMPLPGEISDQALLVKRLELAIDEVFYKRSNGTNATMPTTPQFAQAWKLNTSYVVSMVRRHTGKTPAQFIREFLLLEMKAWLRNHDLSIGDISARVGFDTPTNFSKFFKVHTGMLPKEFRKAENQLNRTFEDE